MKLVFRGTPLGGGGSSLLTATGSTAATMVANSKHSNIVTRHVEPMKPAAWKPYKAGPTMTTLRIVP